MESSLQRAAEISKKHPKPDLKFSYGTAGFRMSAEHLDSVMFRMGLLAVLRSKVRNGKVIGVVVTASHNPVQDNGVKLVDPLGEMLQPSWEKHASDLANAKDIVEALRGVLTEHGIDWSVPAEVFVARDTRPSGVQFVQALVEGVEALGGSYRDFGKRRCCLFLCTALSITAIFHFRFKGHMPFVVFGTLECTFQYFWPFMQIIFQNANVF